MQKTIEINLVDHTRLGWTQGQQITKVTEELGEAIKELIENNPVAAVREWMDVAQTCVTMIQIIAAEWNLDVDKLYAEHVAKLERKEYL